MYREIYSYSDVAARTLAFLRLNCSIVQFYNYIRGKGQILKYKDHVAEFLPLRLLLWMFCRCLTVISRISAFSSLDCCWETSADIKQVQSVYM